jgi:16S rRNA (adenine1518-N6/adenine1519-N6)-dimethyltransferase
LFLELIRLGFSQRRKQLRKLLRDRVDDWDTLARHINIDPKARAEELSLLQWIGLVNLIAPPPSPDARLANNERFPVVDKNDRIQGDASRSEVHANNLRHRAVHILIFNAAGEVYLQQRSRGKDRHPLRWDSSAAGHVVAAESYDETARRELEEELGISVSLERISKLAASERTDQEFIWLYRGETAGAFSPNRTEIETGAFFPQTVVDGWVEARPEDFAPGFIECWKAYRQKNSSDSGALT